jgi:hypothetical protein
MIHSSSCFRDVRSIAHQPLSLSLGTLHCVISLSWSVGAPGEVQGFLGLGFQSKEGFLGLGFQSKEAKKLGFVINPRGS